MNKSLIFLCGIFWFMPQVLPQTPVAAPGSQVTPTSQQEQKDELLQELRAVRALLEKLLAEQGKRETVYVRPSSPPLVKVDIHAEPKLGSPDAPVTVVEFTDFQCEFCQQFHRTIFRELMKKYIETGKVQFVTKDLPLETHPFALRAAIAARCAGEQGKFWEMRDSLLQTPQPLTDAVLRDLVSKLPLSGVDFEKCLASPNHAQDIQRSAESAKDLGVVGTPTFVIGRTSREQVEGQVIIGAISLAKIDAELVRLSSQSASGHP